MIGRSSSNMRLLRYLCLDDEAAKVQPIVQLLEQANADLRIEVPTPIQFDEEIRQLEPIQDLLESDESVVIPLRMS